MVFLAESFLSAAGIDYNSSDIMTCYNRILANERRVNSPCDHDRLISTNQHKNISLCDGHVTMHRGNDW